jgi:MoxR-like ATPase
VVNPDLVLTAGWTNMEVDHRRGRGQWRPVQLFGADDMPHIDPTPGLRRQLIGSRQHRTVDQGGRIPENILHLTGTYSFTDNLAITGSIIERGFHHVRISNAVTLPSYTLLNAGMVLRDRVLEFQLNAKNLTDERYFRSNFPNLFGSTDRTPGTAGVTSRRGWPSTSEGTRLPRSSKASPEGFFVPARQRFVQRRQAGSSVVAGARAHEQRSRAAFTGWSRPSNAAVIGQEEVVRTLLIALLTNGNVLLEGLPGTAKTRSVRTLARVLDAHGLGRIQFTPDLLPSDVTGTEIYRKSTAPAAALPAGTDLQQHGARRRDQPLAGEGAGGTARSHGGAHGDRRRAQPRPATPVHGAGNTESHRAGGHLSAARGADGPLHHENHHRLSGRRRRGGDHPPGARRGSGAAPRSEPRWSQDARVSRPGCRRRNCRCRRISTSYIVALVMATRDPARYADSRLRDWIRVGSSPRASIALDNAARASAWLAGRAYVDPEDVRGVAHAVLRHRLILSYDALAEGISSDAVIDELLRQVAAA